MLFPDTRVSIKKSSVSNLRKWIDGLSSQGHRYLFAFFMIMFLALLFSTHQVFSSTPEDNANASLQIQVDENNHVSGHLFVSFLKNPQLLGKRTFIILPFLTKKIMTTEAKVKFEPSEAGCSISGQCLYSLIDIFEAPANEKIDFSFDIDTAILMPDLSDPENDPHTDFLQIRHLDTPTDSDYTLSFRYDTQTSHLLFVSSDQTSDMTDFVNTMIIPSSVTITFLGNIAPYLPPPNIPPPFSHAERSFSNYYEYPPQQASYDPKKMEFMTSIVIYQKGDLWINYSFPPKELSITETTILDVVVILGSLIAFILNLPIDVGGNAEVRFGVASIIVIFLPVFTLVIFRDYSPHELGQYYAQNTFSVLTGIVMYVVCVGLLLFKLPVGWKILKRIIAHLFRTAQTPTSGSQPPSGTAQTSTGGSQPPSGTVRTPTGGTQPPSGAAQTLAGGSQSPSGTSQPPSGGSQPSSGTAQSPP